MIQQKIVYDVIGYSTGFEAELKQSTNYIFRILAGYVVLLLIYNILILLCIYFHEKKNKYEEPWPKETQRNPKKPNVTNGKKYCKVLTIHSLSLLAKNKVFLYGLFNNLTKKKFKVAWNHKLKTTDNINLYTRL